MTSWTDRLDRIKAGAAKKPPVVQILRLPDIVSWQTGQVVTKWEIDPDFHTIGGQLLCGYVTALADQVMGHTAMTVLDDEDMFRTIQMNTTFYRPMRNGVLWITGKVKQQTHQTIHVNVDFCDVGGDLMASVTGVQLVIPMTPEANSIK